LAAKQAEGIMRRLLNLAFVAAPVLLASSYAIAAPAATGADYDRDVVSVSTFGRHAAIPTADCLVWANAEGLGVGPAQLNGMHGVNMNLNEHPLPSEGVKTPSTFDAAFADMKAHYPTAPAWLLDTIQKNKSAIEAACAQDHQDPFKIYTITARDKRG
jgi:hypothetical protein